VRVKLEEGDFIIQFEINSCGKSLTLCQKEVGDVSCVVWDAALVLAKYLEARCNDMQHWLRGRSVAELGAGMGCVGLTAVCFG
jgi:predicted nicotinamide N-methyase